MHHFAGLPLGARVRVYLGITHQSFSWPDLRGQWRGRRRGRWGPCSPPSVAPSNERRHSHTDTLTPCWSPFFPFLLPSSLYSPLFLPSVNSSCALGNIFVSSSFAFFLPLVSSVSGSLTSTLPHLPHSCHLVLSMLCRKQLLNRHFYWSVWKVELLNGRMGYTRSINCVLVYSICNVTQSCKRDHKWDSWTKNFADCCNVHILYVYQFASQMPLEGHSFDKPTSALGINETPEWPTLRVRSYYFISISFWVLSFKRYKECLLLKM